MKLKGRSARELSSSVVPLQLSPPLSEAPFVLFAMDPSSSSGRAKGRRPSFLYKRGTLKTLRLQRQKKKLVEEKRSLRQIVGKVVRTLKLQQDSLYPEGVWIRDEGEDMMQQVELEVRRKDLDKGNRRSKGRWRMVSSLSTRPVYSSSLPDKGSHLLTFPDTTTLSTSSREPPELLLRGSSPTIRRIRGGGVTVASDRVEFVWDFSNYIEGLPSFGWGNIKRSSNPSSRRLPSS